MLYIVFDLEATCLRNRNVRKFQNEIIEIGAVMLDGNFNEVSQFNSFIKPIINTTLSDFCKELTTITQKDVDDAEEFPLVICNFQKWVEQNMSHEDEEVYYLSWGHYDKRQLVKDCNLHKMSSDWIKENHFSLKHIYQEIDNTMEKYGMKHILEKYGYELEGTLHRGIDDAINLVKIFKHFKNDFISYFSNK